MNLAIAACLVLGLPHGVCRAEIEFGTDFVSYQASVPTQASDEWTKHHVARLAELKVCRQPSHLEVLRDNWKKEKELENCDLSSLWWPCRYTGFNRMLRRMLPEAYYQEDLCRLRPGVSTKFEQSDSLLRLSTLQGMRSQNYSWEREWPLPEMRSEIWRLWRAFETTGIQTASLPTLWYNISTRNKHYEVVPPLQIGPEGHSSFRRWIYERRDRRTCSSSGIQMCDLRRLDGNRRIIDGSHRPTFSRRRERCIQHSGHTSCLQLYEVDFDDVRTSSSSTENLPVPSWPEWATDEWIDMASHIVAGEAANCDSARLITACTIYNDITVRGWGPWTLVTTRGRWRGRNIPHQADYDAVEAAISGACSELPVCLYLGSWQDYHGWIRSGLIDGNDPALIWGDGHSESVCVPMSSLDYTEVHSDEFNE